MTSGERREALMLVGAGGRFDDVENSFRVDLGGDG